MLASSIALGTVAGLALGGRWHGLRDLRLAWWPLAIVAGIMRIAGVLVAMPLLVYLVAIILVAAVAFKNLRISGAILIGAGSLLNALVIALNGGMPVDPTAAAIAAAEPLLNDRLHTVLGPETRLPWLADILPLPIFRNVYSVGDVVIAAGGFWIPFAFLRAK